MSGGDPRFLVVCAALLSCTTVDDQQPGAGGAATAGFSATGGAGGTNAGMGGSAGTAAMLDALTLQAKEKFPTAAALYAGALSRCATGPGGCHTGKHLPDLASVEGFLAGFGSPCQAAIGNPRVIIDECEREGDRLVFADDVERELLRVEPASRDGNLLATATVVLDGSVGELGPLRRLRRAPRAARPVYEEELVNVSAVASKDASKLTLDFSEADSSLRRHWDLERAPRAGADVVVGDANGNGKRLSDQHFQQILPGRPDLSYLFRRLLGSDFGDVMPPTGEPLDGLSLRALYCLIQTAPTNRQLAPNEPIAYDACVPTDLSSFGQHGYPAVQALFDRSCSTGNCHGPDHAANLDLRAAAVQDGGVVGRRSGQSAWDLVAAGDPSHSYLLCKLDATCSARVAGTALMPLNARPLQPFELELVQRWIADGAALK